MFQVPWERIISDTESLAQSHQTLASKIETDVEAPLRQFSAKNREMQAMSTIQGNLKAIAKDVEGAQKKAKELRDKSGRADRVANANLSADDSSQQWESQAPYVFEQLQSLDEMRVNHLRDVLTQFQTHEIDQVERNKTNAEVTLNALLNVETADEIKTFVARVGGPGSNVAGRRSSATPIARPPSAIARPPTPTDGARAGPSLTQDRQAPSKFSSILPYGC